VRAIASICCSPPDNRPAIRYRTGSNSGNDWFRSGDVSYLDHEDFLYLTDRKKDMIISGGENIASSEVERVIYELPQVREVAVIGVFDERWGERPPWTVLPVDAGCIAGSTQDAWDESRGAPRTQVGKRDHEYRDAAQQA
jgi:acyl-coenzyme A synthetase/AMP-(fatty) acid ligase